MFSYRPSLNSLVSLNSLTERGALRHLHLRSSGSNVNMQSITVALILCSRNRKGLGSVVKGLLGTDECTVQFLNWNEDLE